MTEDFVNVTFFTLNLKDQYTIALGNLDERERYTDTL